MAPAVIAAAIAAAAAVGLAAVRPVAAQACSAAQAAAWGNPASANSACANNAVCDCDPRVGTLSAFTESYLPDGCVSSYPDPRICQGTFHNSGTDPCKPLDQYLDNGVLTNQKVYIKDPENFCLLLPNNQSKYLQNWYYGGNGNNKPPSIVEAEGFVQSYCTGSYMPSASRALPFAGVRGAHVVQNFTTAGARFIQISGTLDCGVLDINCQQSSPGAYDDGGQYDTSTFAQCGKEPYSGPDPSSPNSLTPFSTFNQYVMKAGDGIYCMRICEGPDSSYNLGDPEGANARTNAPCDSSQDTKGCEFWGANTNDGFDYTDVVGGTFTSFSVSLPPATTSATSTSASTTGSVTGSASVSAISGSTTSSSKTTGAAGQRADSIVGLVTAGAVAVAAGVALLLAV
ncbi:hypothetical protein HK405_007403 [Cladochytrium tenue]|nr:hypothetical protein HK405_007403 [Cladochytrium tenue]